MSPTFRVQCDRVHHPDRLSILQLHRAGVVADVVCADGVLDVNEDIVWACSSKLKLATRAWFGPFQALDLGAL